VGNARSPSLGGIKSHVAARTENPHLFLFLKKRPTVLQGCSKVAPLLALGIERRETPRPGTPLKLAPPGQRTQIANGIDLRD